MKSHDSITATVNYVLYKLETSFLDESLGTQDTPPTKVSPL